MYKRQLPDVRYPTDNPDRFPIPYPVKPGQPGYVKPTAPPGWKNPYSIPVPIKIPGVPGPGPIIPMVNPDYDRKKPAAVPAGFGGDPVNLNHSSAHIGRTETDGRTK